MIDQDKLKRYIQLDDEIKEREKEQDELKTILKAEMTQDGLKAVKHGNRTLTLTESERVTIKKEDLVTLLATKGLKSCIKMLLEPDMDMIEVSIQIGEIQKEEVDAFIKKTQVQTMKLK